VLRPKHSTLSHDEGASPLIGIKAEIQGTSLKFQFNFGCDDHQVPEIRDVVVGDSGPNWRPTSPYYCRLRAINKTDLPLAGWDYGTTMPGYDLLGICAPLSPARTYSIEVVGQGDGYATIEMLKDGKVRVVDEECRFRSQRNSDAAVQ
jgi:hypothetical protein